MKKFAIYQFADKNIQILPTSLDRKPGEKINVDNKQATVIGTLNGESEKAEFIAAWNVEVRKINNRTARNNKQKKASFFLNIAMQSPVVMDCLKTLAMLNKMGIE